MELQAQPWQLAPSQPIASSTTGRHVLLDGEIYYRISNSQSMPPFFTSLISSADHWLFAASTGGVTLGRRNANHALLPYYSADKLIDQARASGPWTAFRITTAQGTWYWEPFSGNIENVSNPQNLYKNLTGSCLQFEELHPTLALVFRYSWRTSEQFGFVRDCLLQNMSDEPVTIEVLDGLQNILPHGVDENFQLRFSNLVDAYKKSEWLPKLGMGIFYLSSIPTDQAQPFEGLRANTVWQVGLPNPTVLLSSRQLSNFRRGGAVHPETDMRGLRGAYLVRSCFSLAEQAEMRWSLIANVSQDQTDIIDFGESFSPAKALQELRIDIEQGERKLVQMLAGADGIQVGENALRTHRHQSNVVYNLMRGGTPLSGYQFEGQDFLKQLHQSHPTVFARHAALWSEISDQKLPRGQWLAQVESTEDLDLIRISHEYLPLAWSRRHGDPTRPWNSFSIETRNSDGSLKTNYQGNWRDIFQNWEALACAYPRLLPGMVLRFINATTVEGYNPYRLTNSSFEWEEPDPADPWANFGYWGDHQVAYLGKLLEWLSQFSPTALDNMLERPWGVYAQIPYRICSYDQMLRNPYQTIEYDQEWANRIEAQVRQHGADGKLLFNATGQLHRVSVLEKLLLPALAKMSNLIPDAGIWLNTQRPEWNDANNALVGHGASVVTVCYLRRYFVFLEQLISAGATETFQLTKEVQFFFSALTQILQAHEIQLRTGFSDRSRRAIVDQLQMLSSDYRQRIYDRGLDGSVVEVAKSQLLEFAGRCVRYLDQTIEANQRADGLYHSYNLVRFESLAASDSLGAEPEHRLRIEHLYEMLEGQVAVLNSGKLSLEEVCDVLTGLRNSAMYRDDLGTYLLYPDRELPDFCDKNLLPPTCYHEFSLIRALVDAGHQGIVRRDLKGEFRFNGDFRNAADLQQSLEKLAAENPGWAGLVQAESADLAELFRSTFRHQRFTGRSGTFFAYEGLGSVYWHMVSKLLLAVADQYVAASRLSAKTSLLNELRMHFRELRDGLGLSSLPGKYGAFPIDPYSHTPKHAGAQQPGMTGQVKEDILSRQAELGIRLKDGVLSFELGLFEQNELLQHSAKFKSFDVSGLPLDLDVPAGGFAFSFCQVPILYRKGTSAQVQVFFTGRADPVIRAGHELTWTESASIFDRDSLIERIEIVF